MEYNSSQLKCGSPSYKFKSNIMLFIFLKHKETTEGISVLVSLYLQICYDLFFEDKTSWKAMEYLQVLGPYRQGKPKQTCKRVKEEQSGKAEGVGTG